MSQSSRTEMMEELETQPLLGPRPRGGKSKKSGKSPTWFMVLVLLALVAILVAVILAIVYSSSDEAGPSAQCFDAYTAVNGCKMGFSERYNGDETYSAIGYYPVNNTFLRIASDPMGVISVFYAYNLQDAMVVEGPPLAHALPSGPIYRGLAYNNQTGNFFVLGDNRLYQMSPNGASVLLLGTLPVGPIYRDLLWSDEGNLYTLRDATSLVRLNPLTGAIITQTPIKSPDGIKRVVTLSQNTLNRDVLVLCTNHSSVGAPQLLGKMDLFKAVVRKCHVFPPGESYIAAKHASDAGGAIWLTGDPMVGGFPSLGILE